MKIRSIQIENFGQFHALNLKAPDAGLWRISGGNEFGKTTLLEFIRRIFWGFPDRRSNLNFYPAAGTPYGGRLELELDSGEIVTAERLGTGKNGTFRLIRQDGSEQTESEWRALLGISEQFYRNVYAFTIDELGELKALDQEEIRARLYGAGIAFGNVSLPALGAAFDKRAAALCLLHGRKNRIAELSAELRALDAAVAAAEENLPHYEAAREREIAARAASDELHRQRTECEKALRRAERLARGMEPRRVLQESEAQLKQLPLVPAELPADPGAEFARLRALRDQAEEEFLRLEKRHAELEAQLRETPLSELDPALAERLPELEQLLPEFRRNSEELIRLRAVLTQTRRQSGEIAGELGSFGAELPQIPELTLDDSDALRDFIRRRERLELIRAQNPPRLRRLWRKPHVAGTAVGGGILILSLLSAAAGGFLMLREQPANSTPAAAAAAAVTVATIAALAGGVTIYLSIPRRKFFDPAAAEEARFLEEWETFRNKFHLESNCLPATAEKLLARAARWRELEDESLRLQKQSETAQQFVTEFKTRCSGLPGAEPDMVDPAATLATLRLRTTAAAEAAARRAQLATRCEEMKNELQSAALRRSAARSALETFCRKGGAGNEEEFAQNLEQWHKRRQLEEQCDRMRAALRAVFGEDIPPEPDFDPQQEAERLRGELETLATQTVESDRLVGAAATECEKLLHTADPAGAANLAESCRNELRGAVREFLILREARNLLNRAIERYERERQPEVIRRADALFSAFTAGRYTGLHKSLTTGELLALDTESGLEKSPEMLSRGTLEELMLAMRLALIECSEVDNESLPVVLDDITVNFDSRRKAAVLAALETFAAGRQVILFSAN